MVQRSRAAVSERPVPRADGQDSSRASAEGAAGRTQPSETAQGRTPRRWLHTLEAATALMLANQLTVDDSIGVLRMLPVWFRWRAHPVAALVAAAARHPERTAVIDDRGTVSFGRLDRETNALARCWRRAGYGTGTAIGILCEPGRTFLIAAIAAQKLGADVIYLNAAFSPPQIADVAAGESIDAVVADAGLLPAAREAGLRCQLLTDDDLRGAVAQTSGSRLTPPAEPGRTVVLTSGTTGRPKGAQRRASGGALDAAGLLACVPIQRGDKMVIAAPLFHGLGLLSATLGLALSNTVVLRRRFDPETVLGDLAATGASVLVAVPVMLQRILAVRMARRAAYSLPDLRVVLCGGSALSAGLAHRFMDEFGDVLYNFYGSTEAGWATCATPRELRTAPGTVGRPTPGVTVRIADQSGTTMPPNVTGRVLVGSSLRMDRYTDGGGKPVVGGLVATGDLGHFDHAGRLFIDGRDDEMIVSGGENVFPAEVEEVLLAHPAVDDVAVIGVEDAEFGQRLRAFVVCSAGREATAEELRRYVHDRLARFKTPRDVVFIDAMPRNATGKILKRVLARR